jgi:hypothetical protein
LCLPAGGKLKLEPRTVPPPDVPVRPPRRACCKLSGVTDAPQLTLRFDSGTLVLDGAGADFAGLPAQFRWDARVLRWRAPAIAYRHVVRDFLARGLA